MCLPRCLLVTRARQGLCTSLMEFAWKSHISLLYPSPAQFTSFLGDVSLWQGVVTGGLMVRVVPEGATSYMYICKCCLRLRLRPTKLTMLDA